MPPANQAAGMNDTPGISDWFNSLPLITRYWFGGAAEPVAGDEREGVEPVGYARGVVHPGGLVGRRHGDENDLLRTAATVVRLY